MKTIVAIVLGLLSGLLVYTIGVMLFANVNADNGPSPVFVMVWFFGGWAGSAFLLRRGAASVSKVFSRGALLGAAEWLAFAAAGVILSGRLVASSVNSGESDAATAGAAIGGGLAAMMTGGLAIAMSVVCLIVFAVAHFAGREMADRSGTPTKRCQECAEMVQAEARKCKHCGAVLAPSATAVAS